MATKIQTAKSARKCIEALAKARAQKDDEYYTTRDACYQEFPNYDFNGKTVYCNCDNPYRSEIVKYFRENFNELGIKALYATWYGAAGMVYKCTANEYTGELREAYICRMNNGEDGSFSSATSRSVLEKCDVVVTNIPFSQGLPAKFMALMKEYKKDYLTCVHMTSLGNNCFGEYMESGMVRVGYTKPKNFIRPDGTTATVNAVWITNMPVSRKKFATGIVKRGRQPKLVVLDRAKNLPDNYMGMAAVPLSFLQKIDERDFIVAGAAIPEELNANGGRRFTRVYVKRIDKGSAKTVEQQRSDALDEFDAAGKFGYVWGGKRRMA